MRIIYNIFIFFYSLAIHCASIFNSKAKLWVKGRRTIFEQLEKTLQQKITNRDKVFWFHCASLGEFEQGRPLIEKIKTANRNTKILLTFFSPSGYEVRKDYATADFVFYLPIDFPANAKRFVKLLPLQAAFFVKYEFWFNYLHELEQKNIPTYLVSGIFREDHYFFKWYGKWVRKQLKTFTHFFVQDELSKSLLAKHGFSAITVSGDTRFDRVYEIAQNKKTFPLVQLFTGQNKVLIAGSTWEKDEELIAGCRMPDAAYKLIIAPHEVSENRIKQIIQRFKKIGDCIRYSQANEQNVTQASVLIIDNIGMLSSIYQYGHIAYIGGGFGDGIHNILEAATFGLPAIFGPNYKKFKEANELINAGGAFTFNNTAQLQSIVNKLFSDSQFLQKAGSINCNYVLQNKGAVEIILKKVLE